MKKKLLLGLIASLVVIGGVAAFSAFEAHVINVTAQIENALTVSVEHLNLGTVFPQEELNIPFKVSLSSSFVDEGRVDDVQYRIRQKPKCAITMNEGTTLVSTPDETATGHIIVDPDTGIVSVDCGDAPRQLTTDETWGPLPSLCEYLSKHKATGEEGENDQEMDAFHAIGSAKEGGDHGGEWHWVWNQIAGYLAKSAQDTEDNWIIDLKVPCFGDHCAQDWDDFVLAINSSVDPDDYEQPMANEHKIFGCDLWIEVTGISLPGDLGCGKNDVMLVLDRSGSVGGEMPTLKSAAIAFVNALNPSADGIHIGQTSFSSSGSLDEHLTAVKQDVIDAINSLVSSGTTDLEAGITLAHGELANPGDGHDRADGESPDFMVIITDGAPNVPNTTQGKADAEAAADAAGTTIYVVGVGTSAETANWLSSEIATGPSYYFDASEWSQLEAILTNLANCD